ncbi:MAG: biotin transporter BioY [Firmicutes bacterium]|nr:biotin transporter BioY [Bacillota bacterium]
MTATRTYSKTTYMALCGLFAALMAICSFISIPLGFTPVPVNLATLGVFLAGGLLGKKYGTIALTVYVLLGAVGVPVFAGFRGGLSVLAGPTGGYIIGYIAAAFLVGFLIEKLIPKAGEAAASRSAGKEILVCVIAMIVGLFACYLLGTAWFMISTHTGVWASLVSCIFPFLPGDALKIAAGAILVQKLRKMI